MSATSKFLSFVLRHQPDAAGITLDENGWVDIDALLAGALAHGRDITRAELDEIVATNSKKRFSISEDGLRIRANQGHSVEVDLAYEPAIPPTLLYHGTVAAALDAIRQLGLQKMQRHHVHLSPDFGTARIVAQRRGRPIILAIDAGKMHAAGFVFYKSANGVWLTDKVPTTFIQFG